jgi:hypothetical protein
MPGNRGYSFKPDDKRQRNLIKKDKFVDKGDAR